MYWDIESYRGSASSRIYIIVCNSAVENTECKIYNHEWFCGTRWTVQKEMWFSHGGLPLCVSLLICWIIKSTFKIGTNHTRVIIILRIKFELMCWSDFTVLWTFTKTDTIWNATISQQTHIWYKLYVYRLLVCKDFGRSRLSLYISKM